MPSYDPSRDYYDGGYLCEVCGEDVSRCHCPECPTCGVIGDPECWTLETGRPHALALDPSKYRQMSLWTREDPFDPYLGARYNDRKYDPHDTLPEVGSWWEFPSPAWSNSNGPFEVRFSDQGIVLIRFLGTNETVDYPYATWFAWIDKGLTRIKPPEDPSQLQFQLWSRRALSWIKEAGLEEGAKEVFVTEGGAGLRRFADAHLSGVPDPDSEWMFEGVKGLITIREPDPQSPYSVYYSLNGVPARTPLPLGLWNKYRANGQITSLDPNDQIESHPFSENVDWDSVGKRLSVEWTPENHDQSGLPRPIFEGKPVPYGLDVGDNPSLNREGDSMPIFTAPGNLLRAWKDGLCIVCNLALEDPVYFFDTTDTVIDGGLHKRCALLSRAHCPHLQQNMNPLWTLPLQDWNGCREMHYKWNDWYIRSQENSRPVSSVIAPKESVSWDETPTGDPIADRMLDIIRRTPQEKEEEQSPWRPQMSPGVLKRIYDEATYRHQCPMCKGYFRDRGGVWMCDACGFEFQPDNNE